MLSTTRSGHNFIKEVIESWGDYDITVMENAAPENIYQYKLDAHSIRTIVIREFRNNLASAIKGKSVSLQAHITLRESIEYKVNAYRAILKEAEDKEYYDADVVIFYDDFCDSEEYRRAICKKLNGIYTEDRLGFVSSEGNGSSWEKMSLQGKGQEMKTRNRHEQILEDPEWADVYLEILEKYKDLVDEYKIVYEHNKEVL